MFKRFWKWITGQIKEDLLKGIKDLDKYEDDLVELIENELPPKKTAKKIIDFVQNKLKIIVNKIF